MAYPRFHRARAFKVKTKSNADVAMTTTLVAVDTALDIALNAQVGDVIEYSISGLWNNGSANGVLDVATMNGATAVNYFSSGSGSAGASGVLAWYGVGGALSNIGGSCWYTVTAADIVSGQVTLRLLGAYTSTTAKSLLATAPNLLFVSAKNLGPVDPN